MLAWWLRIGVAAGLACVSTMAPLTAAGEPPTATQTGRLKVLTYNVAGLPEGLSGSRPSVNHPVIGGLLHHYDLAVVQEDFAYPLALRAKLRLPHGSPPFVRGERMDFGDGLSQFARLPFSEYAREAWQTCNGVVDSCFDCLTPKGFTFARQQIADQTFVDVYNLHLDAGPSTGDQEARSAQLEQLLRAVHARSAGNALIVAGDFNLARSERRHLDWLEREAGLVDSCRKLHCPEPWRIDRILFRSSDVLKLSARSWRVDRRFVDTADRPLSDHLAVAVELEWSTNGQRFASEASKPAASGG